MASGGFEQRLRRLRREVPAEGSARPSAGLPVWLRRRIGRMRAPPLEDASCPTTVGPPANLEQLTNGHGTCAARVTDFPRDHAHGAWRLEECVHADPAAFALLSGDGALASLDLERAVYLDTETTGLSGGAGTYVYMVGLGWFEQGRFRCWQGFLREPAEERALLFEVARRLARADAVVSFFGKSFDRHRLEDKMRIVGVEPPFEGLPHLDLYHPFSRLTKGHLPDGRLQTMEVELLGLRRTDDLPGALAPAAWFDFLAERAHRLEGVFRHNLLDVLSLVTLAAYLGRARCEERADGSPLAGPAAQRARAVARALLARGDREGALPWLERALEREVAAGGGARDLALLRAETLRLAGRRDEACAAFDSLLGQREGCEDEYTAPALLALAKLLEHGCGDLAGALSACERARAPIERRHAGSERQRLAADLERRVARLTRRLAREGA